MGGYGSGWAREKKTPVEDCWVLSVGKLQRDKLVRQGLRSYRSMTWTNTATGDKKASIGYEIDTLDADAWLRLRYTLERSGEAVDYRVRLTTKPLPWGGVRWGFLCPGRNCGRACRKLYLPNGGRYFACRLCYQLTYTSAQEAHKYDSLFRDLAAEFKMTPGQVNRLLSRP
jgi:hypothetical protein